MRKALVLALLIPFLGQAQETVNWTYDGLARKYLKYVPPLYDGTEPVPVVFAFHGLGDTMGNFYNVGFSTIADTANFIYIVPEALVDAFTNSTAWNSGAGVILYPNSDIDDIGMVNALLDTLIANYNIDQERVYATGFSMGGFFTNRIGCELTDRFEAIASVAGTIGNGITCSPSEKLRVCHFHGTADANVGYGVDGGGVGDNGFGNNVNDWFQFWQGNNECVGADAIGALPDVANDGYTVQYRWHSPCGDGSEVVHYKVIGADHVWLFPNNDIYYTEEIWRFFNGWGPDNVGGVGIERPQLEFSIGPNPTNGHINIRSVEKIRSVEVMNVEGQVVYRPVDVRHIDLTSLPAGVYTVKLVGDQSVGVRSVVKE